MTDRRVIVATGNQGKLGEYRELLAAAGFEASGHDTAVEENGTTYAENAILKAVAALEATGEVSIGDDSGIEVDMLDGFPGLRSARLGPTQVERTAALLRRLEGKPRPWTGRFTCTLAVAAPGRPVRTFHGERRGEVVPEWRGKAGFGYDPIFLIPELGITFGEMDPAEKHLWSHRGAAVKALLDSGYLEEALRPPGAGGAR